MILKENSELVHKLRREDGSRYSAGLMQEAAKRIEDLENALNNLLNDCINFDGGKLTDIFMEEASKVLKE